MRMTMLLMTKTLDPFTLIPYTGQLKLTITWISSFVKSNRIFMKIC